MSLFHISFKSVRLLIKGIPSKALLVASVKYGQSLINGNNFIVQATQVLSIAYDSFNFFTMPPWLCQTNSAQCHYYLEIVTNK